MDRHFVSSHRPLNNPSNSYLGRVQILRFFAAFAVLLAHLQHEVAERIMPWKSFYLFSAIDGGIGVDLFFVISGFIMYHISGQSFGSTAAAKTFIVRRFLRVAPLYYVATFLMLVAATVLSKHIDRDAITTQSIVASFLFLPIPNGVGETVPILKLGWTLNFEVYFYAVFALALAFPKRLGLGVLFTILVGMIVAAAIFPHRLPMLDFWGQLIVVEFLAGIGLAFVFRGGRRTSAWQSIVLIVGGLALAAAFRHFGFSQFVPRVLFHGLPATFIVAGCVFWRSPPSQRPIARALQFCGDASYALYLSHPFSIRGATIVWSAIGAPASPWLFIAFTSVCALATAVFVHIGIEKPIDNFFKRRRVEKTARAVPANG